MKILHPVVVATLVILNLTAVGFGQGTNVSLTQSPAIAQLQMVIAEANVELTNFQTATNQIKLETAQQRVSALEQALAALQEQGPIRPLIIDLKRQRDAIPTPGTEPEKSRRADLDQRIAALEKADTALKAPAGFTFANTNDSSVSWWGVAAIVLVVIVVFCSVIGLGYFYVKSNAKQDADDSAARIRLAKAVTLGAMTFIVLVSVVVLLFAGINAAIAPQDEKKTTAFFDMSKWVLATILPVVGAWVGGVLAYYFGKENFKAGTENAEKLITQLSPQQKLESKKAGDAGLDLAAAAIHLLGVTALLDANLTALENSFKVGGKIYERLPIMDAKKCVVCCLHLSTLNKYLNSLPVADKTVAAKMTLGALSNALTWMPDASFATVMPTDNLASAQTLMKARQECRDIFVTPDGKKSTPAQRWITDDDILRVVNS